MYLYSLIQNVYFMHMTIHHVNNSLLITQENFVTFCPRPLLHSMQHVYTDFYKHVT